ncbi:MAG TPA: ABA4-like family protein [Bryobacteraceae bacterium]|jgi:membrane protein insertase Oxa1/YidC/SpoIIIJ
MTPEQVFSIANTVALLGWLVLIAGWRWKPAATLVSAVLVPMLFAVLYSYLVMAHFRDSGGGFSSLAAVQQLFSNPWALLAGWIHYLAFDLFIGSWQARDAKRNGVPFLLVVPCLALTFLFGPAGLLLYFVIRGIRVKSVVV